MAGEAFVKAAGDINGPCMVCLTPTDTGVGIKGATHGLARGLLMLGVNPKLVLSIIEHRFGRGARIPVDTHHGIRVCVPCAAASGCEATLMSGSSMPEFLYDFSSEG